MNPSVKEIIISSSNYGISWEGVYFKCVHILGKPRAEDILDRCDNNLLYIEDDSVATYGVDALLVEAMKVICNVE